MLLFNADFYMNVLKGAILVHLRGFLHGPTEDARYLLFQWL